MVHGSNLSIVVAVIDTLRDDAPLKHVLRADA